MYGSSKPQELSTWSCAPTLIAAAFARSSWWSLSSTSISDASQHCAECGKQEFLFKLQMVDQPIFNPRMTVQEVITALNKEFG